MSVPDWARAHGAPLFDALIRREAADFDVTEDLGFEFSGDGEHDYLFIEKTGQNTEWISRQLARHAAVPARDVGYSGLKDRHAVTRQWFSVPRWNVPDWGALELEGVCLLRQERHHRKLRRGSHKANLFRLVLHGEAPASELLEDRLQRIDAAGVPNYFGEQRFGRNGANVTLADAWSEGRRLPRHKRSLAISTARSYLFNQFLDERVRDESWNRLLPGDVANLDGTGSVFIVDDLDEELQRRCGEMDVHPAGPLWGEGTTLTPTAPGHENWLKALTDARVKAASRSLRLRVGTLKWSIATDRVELSFRLGRGAYATSVLREIAAISQ